MRTIDSRLLQSCVFGKSLICLKLRSFLNGVFRGKGDRSNKEGNDMKFIQSQQLGQKLIVTQQMRQSLVVLQMAIPDLRTYIEDASLRNPLIELEYNADIADAEHGLEQQEGVKSEDEWETGLSFSYEFDEAPENYPKQTQAQGAIQDWAYDKTENEFYTMLQEQLMRMKWLDRSTADLCAYLINCLDERGYLRFDLWELAQEQNVELLEMEQALYVLQSLQPAGVGARSLQECLILQLAQSDCFSEETLRLVKDGLPLLGNHDYKGIARLLNCSLTHARQAAEDIVSLNPIPSQGYATGTMVDYQYPEAYIRIEDGTVVLELNQWLLPQIHISRTAEHLLIQSGKKEDISYLKKQKQDAQTLIEFVENRKSTLVRLLQDIIKIQSGYFLHGEALVPMTMSQLAEKEGVACSTISRAVSGKSVCFGGQVLQLKDFFSAALPKDEGSVSSDSVKKRIKAMIEKEDPRHPLSDEAIHITLNAAHISIARRTVAKYREELGFLSSSKRKK